MARKGTLGYEMGLLRRKANRAINALTKQITKATSSFEREYYESSIKNLQQKIQATYQKDSSGKRIPGVTKESLAQAKRNIEQATSKTKVSRQEQARKNFVTQQELNAARFGASRYSQEEVMIFYKATERAWIGKDTKNRNQHILEYYGESDLETLIDKVLKANESALDRLKKRGELTQEDEDTLDERYKGAEEKDYATSAEVVVNVIEYNAGIAEGYGINEPNQ